MQTHMHTQMHIHMHTYTHARTLTTHAHAQTQMHTHASMFTYTLPHITSTLSCTPIFSCTHTHCHVNPHILTHMHTCTHPHTPCSHTHVGVNVDTWSDCTAERPGDAKAGSSQQVCCGLKEGTRQGLPMTRGSEAASCPRFTNDVRSPQCARHQAVPPAPSRHPLLSCPHTPARQVLSASPCQ